MSFHPGGSANWRTLFISDDCESIPSWYFDQTQKLFPKKDPPDMMPTIGRIVHFYADPTVTDESLQAAIVTHVEGQMVNLTVFSPSGQTQARVGVPFVDGLAYIPKGSVYCRWPAGTAERRAALQEVKDDRVPMADLRSLGATRASPQVFENERAARFAEQVHAGAIIKKPEDRDHLMEMATAPAVLNQEQSEKFRELMNLTPEFLEAAKIEEESSISVGVPSIIMCKPRHLEDFKKLAASPPADEPTKIRKSSTHKAEVVPVVMEKHHNADRLSVVQVWGYSCVVDSKAWEGVSKAAYIVPDSVVKVTRPEFTWLADQAKGDGTYRVRAKKIRGVVSYGMLVPVPDTFQIGDDASEFLEITRFDPVLDKAKRGKFTISGEEEDGPDLDAGPMKYDVESLERYHRVIPEETPVQCVEKIDGSNVRYVFWKDRFWVKSRNRWVKRTPDYSGVTVESLTSQGCDPVKAEEVVNKLKSRIVSVNGFWLTLEAQDSLMEYLKSNPGTVVFGECYGNIGKLKYGVPNTFAAFDVWKDGKFLNPEEMYLELESAGVPMAPVLSDSMPYKFQAIHKMATGKSLLGDCIREGVVVKPLTGMFHASIGRVILKCVSHEYLGKEDSDGLACSEEEGGEGE